jgi:Ca-activated chloride channel family protein
MFLLAMGFTAVHAQEKDRRGPLLTRILFVMDASNSMNAFWGNEPKINAARRILLSSLDKLERTPDVELALRLYGHQSRIEPGKQDCDDTRLEVPFGPAQGEAIRRTMGEVRCLGTTPIARSLEKAAGDFPEPGGDGAKGVRNVIILITDGIEACDEDPCAVSRALQAKGVVLKPFVIGLGMEGAGRYDLKCVGNYYDASTPEMFDRVLRVVLDQALSNTTTQLLLLTDDDKPRETNIPVTFYDQRTGQQRYNFVHTMNVRGEPDTLNIDPVFNYRVVVHTVPPSVREQVTIEAGRHNVVAVRSGQGTLELKADGLGGGEQVMCVVRRGGELATLNAQPMNSSKLYRTGTYDLEILTLPRTLIPGVTIRQGATTPVRIPQAGTLNVNATTPGPGALFLRQGDRLEWVVDLDPTNARNQFRLQPGDYKVVYRSANASQTVFSVEKDITVQSGRAINLEL